ncbi:MAG: type II secretion system F family protein [Colwellia sp.]|jgi:Type II secretory pathway, component PulF
MFKDIINSLTKPSLTMQRRMELYRIISKYYRDGKNIVSLFKSKAKRAKAKNISGGDVYIKIDESIRKGVSIAESMRPFVPSDEYFYIDVAERRQKAGGMFDSLVRIAESKVELRNSFIAMSIMPIIVWVFGLGILGVITFVMAPQAIDMIGDTSTLEGYSKFIILTVVPFMEVWFPVVLAGICGLLGYVIFSLGNRPRTKIRRWLDNNMVIYSQYREYTAAISLISLSSSVDAGIPFSKYFSLQSSTSAPYFRSVAKDISVRLGDGRYNEAQAIDIGFFTDTDIEQIYDYSDSGSADEAIHLIGREATEIASKRIKSSFVRATFFGVIILLMFVGFYAAGIIGGASKALEAGAF